MAPDDHQTTSTGRAVLPLDAPARRLRDAVEPIATIGYHAPPALDAWSAVGFDFLHGYVWSRVSSLGEPTPEVAVAAYGVWQPAAITAAYESARAAVGLTEMRRIRLRGATDSLRAVLGDPEQVEGLEDTVTALEGAVADASLLGRPLFAGLVGHPQPPDLVGRLWHATNCVREHRGDAHLAALVGAGIDGVQANLLNELWHGFELFSFTGTRYWTQEQMDDGLRRLETRGLVADGRLTDSGDALRVDLEERTDAAEQDVVAALGDGLDTHVGRLDGWSQLVLDRGWYPDEPGKRYAG